MSRLIIGATISLFLCAGCANEHGIDLAIVASDPVPDEVVSWELRLLNIEPTAACPSASQAAGAARVGRLAHAQTFTDVGMAIGEVPEGHWAFAVLGRDALCDVRVYGCTAVTIGRETFSPVTIAVEAAVGVGEACGCRTCEAGACSPVATECE